MKPLDEFLASINPYAPGCALPTAYFAIRQSATDFCEKTRLWRYEDEFPVTVAESESITTPFGAVVHDIERVTFDGMPLEPKTVGWLDAHYPGWRTGAQVGMPRFLTQLEPNTLRIVPGCAGKVQVSVWLKPAQDCDELPDFLADQHREAIAHGALARILVIPNQPFTNPQLAAAFAAAFDARLTALKDKGTTGQQRARVRTRASFY